MNGDLSTLNEAERRILALLAEGHTAKSIAAETGSTVNAVNERLRDARRKTGAGSSRELARMLRDAEGGAQENRDKQIEVAAAAAPAPAERRAIPRRWGVIAMILTVSAAALAALLFQPQVTGPQVTEPQAGPPRVVSFGTTEGNDFKAGKATLRVTFDRPMRPNSYSFVTVDEAPFPDCAKTPRQTEDGRSFLLDCTLVAGVEYGVGINYGRFRNFVAARGGTPAEATKFVFAAE